MKKLFGILLLSVLTLTLSAQDKFVGVMKSTIPQINYMSDMEDLQNVANKLNRIGNAEQDEWLPYYYEALTYIFMASRSMESDASKIQGYVERAKDAFDKAYAIESEHSEMLTLEGYLHMAHIWINPMVNGAKYSPMASASFAKALEANPNNPRPYYLDASSKYFTPEAFGGGPKVAKPLFVKAQERFETFEPESEIHPDWGIESNKYFLGLYGDSNQESGEPEGE